jgi:hypothetical protein
MFTFLSAVKTVVLLELTMKEFENFLIDSNPTWHWMRGSNGWMTFSWVSVFYISLAHKWDSQFANEFHPP